MEGRVGEDDGRARAERARRSPRAARCEPAPERGANQTRHGGLGGAWYERGGGAILDVIFGKPSATSSCANMANTRRDFS